MFCLSDTAHQSVSDKDNLAIGPKLLFHTFILYNVEKVKPPYPLLFFFYQSVFESGSRLRVSSGEEAEPSGDSRKRFSRQTRTHADAAETPVTHRKLERLKQGSSWGDTWQNDDLMRDAAVEIPMLAVLFWIMFTRPVKLLNRSHQWFCMF